MTDFNTELRGILDRAKTEFFTADHAPKATDEETLGILTAHFFEWDGLAVLRTAEAGLEDANFHSESALVGRMAERVEEGVGD